MVETIYREMIFKETVIFSITKKVKNEKKKHWVPTLLNGKKKRQTPDLIAFLAPTIEEDCCSSPALATVLPMGGLSQ
jgi:hypothetical protein